MRLMPVFCCSLFVLAWSGDAQAWGKKKKGPPATGWVNQGEGLPDCYQPPDFSTMNTIDRKMKRSDVLDEVLNQWRGQRSDGVSFNEVTIDKVETVLWGRPNRIEEVATENYIRCKADDKDAWESWAASLPAKLTVGECNTPFDYTMFDHLDIETGWQRPRPICKGDRVVLKASAQDKYRITDDGPWINVTGDPNIPTSGSSDWPCNIEGCFAGVLMFRFVGESGQSSVHVAGPQLSFTAPEHGTIDYRINDTQFFDNKWYQTGGIVDHTSIEISPPR